VGAAGNHQSKLNFFAKGFADSSEESCMMEAASDATTRRPVKLLVVEDNLVNQRVSQSLLKRLGFEVDIASNGEEGVRMWETQEYAAIIMDCQMPVLDGYSATALIRQKEEAERRPRLPIIALTANALPHDRQKCLDAGMDDYLTKPVLKQDLGDTLARWLGISVPVLSAA
jgi:CheY-like chemotaxis protein